MTPEALRIQSAAGTFEKPTAGYCPGYVQANLAAFPERYAEDFESFCQKNPKPCPLLEVIGPETSRSEKLAAGADIRDVIPRYQIWRNGVCTEAVQNIKAFDTRDFVYFLLGCSFSFEEALIEEGILYAILMNKRMSPCIAPIFHWSLLAYFLEPWWYPCALFRGDKLIWLPGSLECTLMFMVHPYI